MVLRRRNNRRRLPRVVTSSTWAGSGALPALRLPHPQPDLALSGSGSPRARAHRARTASRPPDPTGAPARGDTRTRWLADSCLLRTSQGGRWRLLRLLGVSGRKIGTGGRDATGHGMPAALVMATTRGMLRAVVQSLETPGEVLARVNEALVADVPPSTFVTCFYGILEPKGGHLSTPTLGTICPTCGMVAIARN